MSKLEDREFYVYEHWRPDKGLPFYVGKGKGKRANAFGKGHRGKRHQNICKKLHKLGLAVEVRVVFNYLQEEQAFELEKSQISYWRSQNIQLINQTGGGEGLSGYQFTPAQLATKSINMLAAWSNAEFREKCAAGLKAAVEKPEFRAALSAGVTATWAALTTEQRAARSEAIKITSNTPESKAKRKAAAKEAQNRPEVKEPRRALTKRLMADPIILARQKAGLKLANARPEVIAKRSASQKRVWGSPEGKASRSSSMKGMWAKEENRKAREAAFATPEVRARIRAGLLASWARRKAAKETTDL